MDIRQKVLKGRTALILEEPFFGGLAMKLKVVEDTDCKSYWTDGESFGYNPDFMAQVHDNFVMSIWLQKVLNCALKHVFRRNNREAETWNKACEYATNELLERRGYWLPEGSLLEHAYREMTAEQIYDKIFQGKPQEDKAPPEPNPSPESDSGEQESAKSEPTVSEVRDAPAHSEEGESVDGSWTNAIAESLNSGMSLGPGGEAIFRALKKVMPKSRYDWKEYVKNFAMTHYGHQNQTWSKPNSSYAHLGLYLPSMVGKKNGKMIVAFDVSGSMSDNKLVTLHQELAGMMSEVEPEEVLTMYCDYEINKVVSFFHPEEVQPCRVGGRGTDFRPVFEAIKKMDEEPACLIYFTDLDGRFPEVVPGYPVLWVDYSSKAGTPYAVKAPFGETAVLCD